MKRYLSILLVLVLTTFLCGCQLMGDPLAGLQPTKETGPVEVEGGYLYTLPGDTTLHTLPGSEQPTTATAKAGDQVVFRMVVEYEGTYWACTADGWFPVENVSEYGPYCALYTDEADWNMMVVETAPAYAEPSEQSAVIGQVQVGTVEHITHNVVKGYHWWLFDAGWIREDYVVPIDHSTWMGIICVEEAVLYAQADTASQVVGTPKYGADIQVYIEVTVDGTQWVYAEEGWILKEDVFVFHGSDTEPGEGACEARVPSGTRANCYLRPSTESEVLTTLDPCIIEILAQFTYDEAAWGITEMGWIPMDTVEILE